MCSESSNIGLVGSNGIPTKPILLDSIYIAAVMCSESSNIGLVGSEHVEQYVEQQYPCGHSVVIKNQKYFFFSSLLPFDILSHSVFWLSTFCRSMFCPFGVCDFDILSVWVSSYSTPSTPYPPYAHHATALLLSLFLCTLHNLHNILTLLILPSAHVTSPAT